MPFVPSTMILHRPFFHKTALFLAAFLVFVLQSAAQEQVFPLNANPALKAARHELMQQPLHRRSANDTILLPFNDDFSRVSVYPVSDLWIDSNAFINTSYPDNPVTIGVATLDGIDQFGNPYDITSTQSSIADYLTSRPIDLSGSVNDTSIWLSFFYQAEGLGDVPETRDSLVLEFRDTSGSWIHQWSVPGRSDTAFQRVNIRVRTPKFLYKGFQFRFYNYATINGNRDHWHLDYVIMRANTVANDSIRDNGFIRPRTSLLNEFTSMPYSHYKSLSNPATAMVTDITDSIRDINYGPTSFIYTSTIKDQFGNSLFSSAPSSLPGASNTITAFNTSLNGFSFPASSAKTAEFEMKNFVTITGTQSNLYNDTVYHRQKFYNYYSYDDGTAELGYGVQGNSGVYMAYQFDIKKADTLRGIEIYFNPTGVNLSSALFQLAYWNQLSVSSNSDNLVYKMINQRPENIDSINGFAQYLFDTLLVVQPGPIWIGFIQNDATRLYGIGLDRNTDSRGKMFYHVDGFWYASNVQGSWLMRPLLGDSIYDPTIGIEEPYSNGDLRFNLFPNPANEKLVIQFGRPNHHPASYSIVNLTGETVMSGTADGPLDMTSLVSGFYLVRVTDERSGLSGIRKLLISR